MGVIQDPRALPNLQIWEILESNPETWRRWTRAFSPKDQLHRHGYGLTGTQQSILSVALIPGPTVRWI